MQDSFLDNRTIRVFISSTFHDMQDERDELMKRTFPMLRQKASERDVTLTEVDLRWGITPEESESGKVVEICLREIENSEPFFIGIIGNRYGWIPSPGDLGESLLERFDQVDNYVERRLSVTEMEMQFGVLERPEDMHAFFFIKEQESDDVDEPEKLAALKAAVRSNGRYPVSTYSSPEDLALQVERAFTKLLDQLYPEGALSELEKERVGQRAYLNSLCQNYIRTDANFAAIDGWMQDWEKHQLVITGASGLGKSALVANWVKEKTGEELPYKVIYHFVGNGGSLGSHGHVIRALCDEIRDRYGFEAEDKEAKADGKALEELFNRVAAEGDKPMVIVLDAINQIVDIDNSKQLNWLPIPPKKVKILFTTLEDDQTMEVFKSRRYPVFTLQPLTEKQREEMARGYLGLYSKKLQPHQIDRIVADKQCMNTLVLKTLLDELVNFGVFEQLDEKIGTYLGTGSVEDFFGILLEGYEADFGEPLVKHVLSLIAVSRNGLSEDEILSITQATPLHWSQFFCAIKRHFVVKNGLITFAHSYIRRAAECRYLEDQGAWEKSCRKKIVTLFYKLYYESKSRRAMDEIPYQLDKLDDLASLHDFILNLPVFAFLVQTDSEEGIDFGRYWRRLTKAGYSLKEYLPRMEDESEEYREAALSHLRDTAGRLLGDSALARLFGEQELLCSHDDEAMARSLNGLGCLYQDDGFNDKAFEYKMKALDIRRRLYGDKHPLVAESYNNVASAYSAKQEFQKALDCMMKSLEIVRDAYSENHRDVASAYNNIGAIYQDLNDLPKALDYGLKALGIQKSLFGEMHLDVANSYNNLGVAYGLSGYLQKSLECFLKAEEIGRALLGEHHPKVGVYIQNAQDAQDAQKSWRSVFTSHFSSAVECVNKSDWQGALQLMLDIPEIQAERSGDNGGYVRMLYYETGFLYCCLQNVPDAYKYLSKTLEIHSYLGVDDDYVAKDSHMRMGFMAAVSMQYEQALTHLLQAYGIAQSIQDHSSDADLLYGIGMAYGKLGRQDKAEEYLGKAAEAEADEDAGEIEPDR